MNDKRLRISLLGFTLPDYMLNPVIKHDTFLPIQTNRFAWSLARALRSAECDVQLLSAVPSSNYPLVPIVWFCGSRFESAGFLGRTLGFINIIGLKHLTRLIACFTTARRWIVRHDSRVIMVHGVHSSFLWFAISMRSASRKVVIVLTDPPGVVVSTDSVLARILKRLDIWIVRSALSRADGVIALTQPLIDDYARGVRGLVLQGFVDPRLVEFSSLARSLPDIQRDDAQPFTLAYAGGLFAKYGVRDLVRAVRAMNNDNVRLELFGKGDLEPEIRSIASMDARIFYGGTLSPSELYPKLQRADLLVNPRFSNEAFVRYSFPSKIIEYMALGVPVLTTRLPCIPSDFLDYLLIIEDETVAGFQCAIENVISTPRNLLVENAMSAQAFVLSSASELEQGNRITSLLNSITQQGQSEEI